MNNVIQFPYEERQRLALSNDSAGVNHAGNLLQMPYHYTATYRGVRGSGAFSHSGIFIQASSDEQAVDIALNDLKGLMITNPDMRRANLSMITNDTLNKRVSPALIKKKIRELEAK